MKLVQIGKKKNMLAFDFGDGKKVWCNCSAKVLEFVKKNFKVGDEVTPTFGDTEKDGMKFVTLVKKGTVENKATVKSNKPVCEVCGKELKDSRYTKCYECAKKKSAPKSLNIGDKEEVIKREAVAHATSRVMIALQGQVDINNVTSVYTTIYNSILALVEGKK